jgi:hypothetical protein
MSDDKCSRCLRDRDDLRPVDCGFSCSPHNWCGDCESVVNKIKEKEDA